MTSNSLLILLVAIAIAYPILMRVLLEAAQPIRLALADLGNELLRNRHFTEHQRVVIIGMMEDAFEWRFLVFVFIMSPKFAWQRFMRRQLKNPFADVQNEETRRQVQKFIELFLTSSLATNPLFGFLVIVQFLALAGILYAARTLDGGMNGLREAANRLVARTEDEYISTPWANSLRVSANSH